MRNRRVARRSFKATGHYLPKYPSRVGPARLRTNSSKASIMEVQIGTEVLVLRGVTCRKIRHYSESPILSPLAEFYGMRAKYQLASVCLPASPGPPGWPPAARANRPSPAALPPDSDHGTSREPAHSSWTGTGWSCAPHPVPAEARLLGPAATTPPDASAATAPLPD